MSSDQGLPTELTTIGARPHPLRGLPRNPADLRALARLVFPARAFLVDEDTLAILPGAALPQARANIPKSYGPPSADPRDLHHAVERGTRGSPGDSSLLVARLLGREPKAEAKPSGGSRPAFSSHGYTGHPLCCLDIEIAPQGAFLVVGCGTNWSATTGSTGLPDLERISGSAAIGPRDTSPKRRRRIRDLGGELFVGTGNILLKVKTGKVRAPASLACMSDLTEDAGESPLAAGVFESWRPICNRMARAIWLDWVGQTCRKGHE